MSVEVTQLRTLVENLTMVVAQESQEFWISVKNLENAAQKVAKSWSGSSIGYHSLVYYRDFSTPPEGSLFNPTWGLEIKFSGTVGDWVKCDHSDVVEYIEQISEGASIAAIEWLYVRCVDLFTDGMIEFDLIVESYLKRSGDVYVSDMQNRAKRLCFHSVSENIRDQLPKVEQVTMDARAKSGGMAHSPHHEVLAKIFALRSSVHAVKGLMRIAYQVCGHLERMKSRPDRNPIGDKVFIGHGQSLQWRELKDFIESRLKLPCEEFNSVPVAGRATVDRLKEMLDNAAIAFLVMTAEDDMLDGSIRARENVVHEAGLFQGRLGFERAIVLVEESCHEFSNIHGLGLIKFSKGNLSTAFERIRLILEREGLIN